jgi:hypothetical protein
MGKQIVTLFRPYEFKLDQKIHIESGPRKGDWEIVGMTDGNIGIKDLFV